MQFSIRPLILLSLIAIPSAFGQLRHPQPIWDGVDRKELQGTVSPRIKAANDLGPLDSDQPLPYITFILQRSETQQAELEKLLAEQQDPTSPNYHRWLTPEEYAARFAPSQAEVDRIAAWLKSQGLTVKSVGRARNWIAFAGSAQQVQRAFGTEIHKFGVDGKTHYSNTTEPAIPTDFAGLVRSIHGLNDFRLKAPKASLAPVRHALDPKYPSKSGNHYLAPGDFHTIYNVKPLHSAGFTGAGQKIVVVGQTQVKPEDIRQFRSDFGLPAADPQLVLVPSAVDPGIKKDDMSEADLDIEWAGAVAPDATIVYVYADDVMNAVGYAIDQNLAPVLSMSYGACEALSSRGDALTMRALAQQANAQGMTWLAASGDDGAADCGTSAPSAGLAVDMPASIPEVTGIGGTTFNEADGSYWSATNDSGRASALFYIPETSWNDSSNGVGGGGASVFFSRPVWQTGASVPDNNSRFVPDVALAASPDHDGYLVYNDGDLGVIGGTSAGAPSLAGVVALLNQYLTARGLAAAPGVGNINPRLYALAGTTPSVFHDVLTGSNIVNSCTTRRTCAGSPIGFNAGPGYDQVTGLGSVDAYRLVTAWSEREAVALGSVSVKLSPSATTVHPADFVTLTATVTSANGGTPTGTVTFYRETEQLGSADLSGNGNTASASINVSVAAWPAGTLAISAQYGGDASFAAVTATASITVQAVASGPISIAELANAASYRQDFAPGSIATVFGANLAPGIAAAATVPLPAQLESVSATVNGIAAPLYYVSPGQINFQVPYETAANSTALLTVNNNGQTASAYFRIATTAPGIFVDVSGTSLPVAPVRAGQVATLFFTGQGALSTSLPTGSAPASTTPVALLPRPEANVAVTIDGTPAIVQFAGNPAGLVGVTQLNYEIPASVGTGPKSVVVTIGGTSSPAATLNVSP